MSTDVRFPRIVGSNSSKAASQDLALLRYARTHSGFVPSAAIAVRSCVVEHRKIAVQYLTSRSSLILTRAIYETEVTKINTVRHPPPSRAITP